jgi:predicted house-cleaning noncanonical NTP pyrophosphatase (MazG superfamily)
MTKELKALTTFADLTASFSSDSTVQAYVLRPTPQLMREQQFLEAVGKFVAKQNRPLYFEGSLLGHSYYVLRNAGAHVVPIVDEPVVDTKPYYKLVRDEIPTIIRQAGGLARLRTLSKQDARILLARKLIEEAFLSQIIPFQDTDLEKLYTFIRLLIPRLPKRSIGPGVVFDDEVNLKYYRLQKTSEGSISLIPIRAGYVPPYTFKSCRSHAVVF